MLRAKAKAKPKAKAATTEKVRELEKSNEFDERIDQEADNDNEEMMDEEVEYEEVEVEEEVEEIEEEEEEEEEDDPEEEEEDDDDEEEEEEEEEQEEEESDIDNEDEREKHAKLLAFPPHGSEVYIGGIPFDASEEDLKGFCEVVGEVTKVRIMRGKDNVNKGFAFVSFRSVELASKAIGKLNNTEFQGKKIKCSSSQAKHRLFIGNLPRSWGNENLKKIVAGIGPGLTVVEVVKDMKIRSSNRGFAFIEYYNYECAEYARKKMMSPKFKLGDNAPTVSWADPKSSDPSPSQQVKAVYVKNLPKDITENRLRKLFEHHGKITKVFVPPAKSGQKKNRIGFVHFSERSSAMRALKNTEKYELDGYLLDCSLAKPPAEQKSGGGSNSQKSESLSSHPPQSGYGLVGGESLSNHPPQSGYCLVRGESLSSHPPQLGYGLVGGESLSSHPPQLGYGLVGGAYGAPGAVYGAAGFAQPLIYGNGQNPAGVPMMPMLLPDGRIGYVLQQPAVIQQPVVIQQTPPSHEIGGSWSGNGGRSSMGRHGNDNGRRYRPY